MKGMKAPRIDGLPAIFFQRNWNLLIALFDAMRSVAAHFANIQFTHKWRQANYCADHLAIIGFSHGIGRVLNNHPP